MDQIRDASAPARGGAPIALARLERNAKREALICFSHVRWNHVTQRPQHLMARAARRYEVVFFEQPVFNAVPAPRLALRRSADGVTVALPVLPVGLPFDQQNRALAALLDALLADLPAIRRVFWYDTPMALAFSATFESDATVYDSMDELAAFRHEAPALLEYEHDLFARADLVFCAGQSLYEAKRHRHHHAYAFPSNIDRVHFAQARHAPPAPDDLAAIPRPRLGFFGDIDPRLDLDLLDRVASESPDWHWVMLGPFVKIDPAILPRHANLHWLGAKSYQALPAYLAHLDLGVMPYALNEATRFMSPTNTAEFLAAGVPVVSTPIHDVVRPYGELGLVEIALGWEQFLSEARLVLRRPSDVWLDHVDQFLAGMSWDQTWHRMDTLIQGVLAENERGAHDLGPVAAIAFRADAVVAAGSKAARRP